MAKKLIILGVILLLITGLSAALYFLNKSEASAPSSSMPITPAVYVLGGQDSPPVTAKVSVHNEKGGFTAVNKNPSGEKANENYTIEGLEKFTMDGYGLSGVIEKAAVLVAKTTVYESGADFAAYGLNSPRATADISYADGSSSTLLLGDDAPGNEGVYAAVKDNPAVYLIASSNAEPFLKSKFDFVDKRITTGIAEDGGSAPASTFTAATLSGTVRAQPIVIKVTPEEERQSVQGFMFNTHQIVSPIEGRLNLDRGLSPIQAVFGLSADAVEAVVSSPADLAKYGLDSPYSTIEVDSPEEGKIKLTASSPDADGKVFLYSEGNDLVYRVSLASVPWLECQLFDFLDTMVVLPFIDNVASVTVTVPETSATFLLSGTDDELKIEANGKELELKNFKAFYQTLIAASYEAYTEETLPEGAKPILEIAYKYRDGSNTDTVRFYEGPARRVFVRLNDKAPYYGLSTYVDRVKSDLPKVLENEKVISYF